MEKWIERSAIAEFEGKLPLMEAEALATMELEKEVQNERA
jgi:hypothetical protein